MSILARQLSGNVGLDLTRLGNVFGLNQTLQLTLWEISERFPPGPDAPPVT